MTEPTKSEPSKSEPTNPPPRHLHPTTPLPASAPSAEHGTSVVARDLIALCRNTSRGLAGDTHSSTGGGPGYEGLDDIDYWYRLGQRNAYAQAAGLLLARAVAEDPFAIAERIAARLDAGVTDLDELRSAAFGTPTTERADALNWLGPQAFTARYGPTTPADRDYGMRWGARGDQRIMLRPKGTGGRGLLFVHDPVWDEYAVLAADVPSSAVEAAYHRAAQIDIHLDPARFASLVGELALAPTPALGVQL